MGAQETIHAALTVSKTIENHIGSLQGSVFVLRNQRNAIRQLAGGTLSGETAVRLLDSAASSLEKTVWALGDTSADLVSFAGRIQGA